VTAALLLAKHGRSRESVQGEEAGKEARKRPREDAEDAAKDEQAQDGPVEQGTNSDAEAATSDMDVPSTKVKKEKKQKKEKKEKKEKKAKKQKVSE
jgi:hypothetical protein